MHVKCEYMSNDTKRYICEQKRLLFCANFKHVLTLDMGHWVSVHLHYKVRDKCVHQKTGRHRTTQG